DYSREYRAMYGVNLSYGQPHTALVFDVATLDLPIVQSERTVRRFLRGAPTNIIVKYKNADSLAARVRGELKRKPGGDAWPAFGEMAALFLMTPSTFRRRLEQEGQ